MLLEDRGARRLNVAALIALASHALVLTIVALTRPAPKPASAVPSDEEIVAIDAVVDEPARKEEARGDTEGSSVGVREEAARPEAARARRRRGPVVAKAVGGEREGEEGGGEGDAEGAGEGKASGSGDGAGAEAKQDAPAAATRSDTLPAPLVPRVNPAPSAVFDVQPVEQGRAAAVSLGSAIQASVTGGAEAKAPQHGHGEIRVEVGADGAVLGVTATSPSWGDAARAIAQRLVGRKLRVPEGAKSVTVTYKVDADATNPKNYLQGDPRVLVPCGTIDKDTAGRMDWQPNVMCAAPGVRLRFDVSIKLIGEEVKR